MNSVACETLDVPLGDLGTRLSAVRLCVPEDEAKIQLSLSKQGQLAPVLAYRAQGGLELFDGLKRVRAAQALSWSALRVEVHDLDEPGAKVRLVTTNTTKTLSDLELAWVVRALYREDRLTQPEIAQLFRRDKSWVCRKLMLAEGLSDEVTASIRLGLLASTSAVELSRLQRCNQGEVAAVVMTRGLTTRQTARLVEAYLQAPAGQQAQVLKQVPIEAGAGKARTEKPKRTPGEQLVADAYAMKGMATRLQVRLMERSLESLGYPAAAVVARELHQLKNTLASLSALLATRLEFGGGQSDASP